MLQRAQHPPSNPHVVARQFFSLTTLAPSRHRQKQFLLEAAAVLHAPEHIVHVLYRRHDSAITIQ